LLRYGATDESDVCRTGASIEFAHLVGDAVVWIQIPSVALDLHAVQENIVGLVVRYRPSHSAGTVEGQHCRLLCLVKHGDFLSFSFPAKHGDGAGNPPVKLDHFFSCRSLPALQTFSAKISHKL
jgi:hypothetical protein